MTRQEFEHRYTNGNPETLVTLQRHGRYAIPCPCDDPACSGWQMASLFYGEPHEIVQIINDYPEVADKIDPAAAQLYKIAAEIDRKMDEKYA